MSTLQVSNLHFESTGDNRIQYTGANSFSLIAGGQTVATVNSTAINSPLALTANTITSDGTLRTSNLHFESTGNNRIQYTGANGVNLVVGGQTVATVNTTSINSPLALSVNTITSDGTLQVSNLHFESTGNNRIQYAGANGVNLVVGGQTVANLYPSGSTWSSSQRGTVTTDNDGSFDMNVTNNFKCTPSGTISLTFTNVTSGQSGYVLLDNTGGHAITANTNTKVNDSFLTTVSTAGTYLCSYFADGTTNVYVTTSGAMS